MMHSFIFYKQIFTISKGCTSSFSCNSKPSTVLCKIFYSFCPRTDLSRNPWVHFDCFLTNNQLFPLEITFSYFGYSFTPNYRNLAITLLHVVEYNAYFTSILITLSHIDSYQLHCLGHTQFTKQTYQTNCLIFCL